MKGLLIALVCLFLTLVFAIKTYIKHHYLYWQKRNVLFFTPTFPLGNAGSIFSQEQSFCQAFNDVYFKIKAANKKEGGFFFLMTPQYIPIDPDIIQNILRTNFSHFMDRGLYYNEKHDPLSAHLFTMEGSKWKRMRTKLSPTFTSGKMKMMFPAIIEVTEELVRLIKSREQRNEPVEMKDLLARMTTDIIGTCAFGINCNSLKDPNAEFRKYGNLLFELSKLQQLINFCTFVLPNLMRFLGVRGLPKDCTDFFLKVFRGTVIYREENNIQRKDFVDLLIKVKNNVNIDDETMENPDDDKIYTIEELAGQSLIFFLAGYETSSTTMSFCLYELSRHNNIQDKLRYEIQSVLENYEGTLTYEALSDMKYMDMVINETLRKYPPVPVLNRICTKEYIFPETNLKLQKGTQIIIPIQGLHYDPKYYPDPDNFNPERFSEENRSKLHPCAFLPFGSGPRNCIGMRFGMMQTKVGLALLLNKYRFELNSKTPVPLEMDKSKFLNTTVSGIWMDILDTL